MDGQNTHSFFFGIRSLFKLLVARFFKLLECFIDLAEFSVPEVAGRGVHPTFEFVAGHGCVVEEAEQCKFEHEDISYITLHI